MSRIESLREMIKTMGSMTQPTRHHPIVITTPHDIPYNNNTVRAILGEPLLVRRNDGSYARDERGFLMQDHMAVYKAHRTAAPANYSLDDVKFADYVKTLSNIPVSEMPFRKMRLRPRRQSSYEMALWGGIQWGGRTPAGAIEHALRQVIRATIPKAPPYLVKLRHYLDIVGKCRIMGNPCREYFGHWTDKYYGMTKQDRKLQEILNDRFDVDSTRLSAQLAASYPELPIDGRFAMSHETYAWAYKSIPRSLRNSTGHWD